VARPRFAERKGTERNHAEPKVPDYSRTDFYGAAEWGNVPHGRGNSSVSSLGTRAIFDEGGAGPQMSRRGRENPNIPNKREIAMAYTPTFTPI
jgi:hypothetical protein